MVTALTLYPNQTVTSILANADQLLTAPGGPTTNKNTTFGSGSNPGFGQIASRGSSSWQGGGSIGSPNGRGFLLDSSLLDAMQIIAGNWTSTLKLGVEAGSIVADLYVRAYLYNSGIYTQIGASMTLLAQTISSTTGAEYAFAGTSLPLQSFQVGQRLYLDVWANITSNSGATIMRLWTSSSASQGSANTQIVTPGYQAAPVVSSGNPAMFVHRRKVLYP